MKPSANPDSLGDEILLRYLVGPMAHEAGERLDELSIADEGFAMRLRSTSGSPRSRGPTSWPF
jgi:hypothetical protein